MKSLQYSGKYFLISLAYSSEVFNSNIASENSLASLVSDFLKAIVALGLLSFMNYARTLATLALVGCQS